MRKICLFAIILFLLPLDSYSADKVVVVPLGNGPYIGKQDIVPGSGDQAISQGYHDGTGVVSGDADLVPGNIRQGVTLFDVSGNLSSPAAWGCRVTPDGPWTWSGQECWDDCVAVSGNDENICSNLCVSITTHLSSLMGGGAGAFCNGGGGM